MRLEGRDGGRRDHAAISHHADATDAEAASQALDHRQQGGHVRGVAGPEEGGDRPVLLVQHDAQHDLVELRAVVLGRAALTQRGATAALEIQRAGVEEGNRDRAEQRTAMRMQRLLDRVGAASRREVVGLACDVLTEPGHRLVGVIKRQAVRARKLDGLAPGPGVAVGAGDHQPMQHGEIDGALGVEAELAATQMPLQHLAAAGLLPEPAEHQVGADAAAT